MALIALLGAPPALADGLPIARDAETEALIQDYARPIFAAAGLRQKSVQIFLVQSDEFNAFVADPTRMFVNTGTIIDAKVPNELIGVIAHETGHLAHGDLAAIRQQMKNAAAIAMLTGLIGMGGAVAAGLSGAPNLSRLSGTSAIAGMQVAQRSVLAYQRTQESSADRTAIDFLEKTGQSPAGLLATLKRLANETLLSSRFVDPYIQNHPLPSERVIALATLVDKSPFRDRKDPPELQRRHDLVRAKIVGFTWAPDRVARRFPSTDTSLPARYARAIVTYRRGALAPALQQIDGLIQAEPGNAYFWELKGQALFEGGKAAAAIPPLNKAVSLAPQSGLIRVLLGQALVAAGGAANVDEAIKHLTIGLQADPDVPTGYRALGRAYALKNDIPMAELATAQGLFAEGNYKEAKLHAHRAQAKLKLGTPAWLRADDIVSYKPPKLH